MDVEILLHGIPDGQDFYGIKEEQTNMGLFYDSSKESLKFVIETKKQGNTAYTYYSYLRYKGMIGASGRPGSYFGLTLRIDKYYQDALQIYNLLDIVFNRYIVGTLLMPAGEAYKYSTANFASKSSEIAKIQQALFQLIQATCSSSKFLNIDASLIHPISAIPTANITDVDDATIMAYIKQSSKIVLSPDYETNIERAYKKKLLEAEGKGGNLVAQKDKIIAEKEQIISTINATLTKQKNQISSLEQQIVLLEAEIQRAKKGGDLTQLITKIKEPITALAEYFRIQEPPKPHTPKFGRKNFFVGLFSCGMSAIILALCVFILLGGSPEPSDELKKITAENISLKEANKKLEAANQQLNGEIQSKDIIISQLEAKNQQTTPTTASVASIPQKLKIDIKDFKTGAKLSVSNTYTIRVMDGKTKHKDNKGSWTLKNADLVENSKASNAQIKIKPKNEGEVTFTYIPVDTNYICQPRTETAEKATVNFDIIISPSTDSVEVGKEYTFSISGYEGDGVWAMDGFEPLGDKNALTIKVKALSEKKEAVISYTPSGKNKKKRSFMFKQEKEK